MMQDLVTLLEQQGLSEKQARVYIACLHLGQAPGSTIARRAEMTRLQCYNTLAQLITKGMASSIVRNETKWYSVIAPAHFARLQQERYDKQRAALQTALPLLARLQLQDQGKPQVMFFDGLRGLQHMYEESLDSETMHAILGREEMDSAFELYLYEDYVPRRTAKQIQTQLIFCQDSSNAAQQFLDANDVTNDYREIRMIRDSDFVIKNSLYMHSENKVSVAFFSQQTMSGVTIKNQDLYDSMMSIFGVLWGVAS